MSIKTANFKRSENIGNQNVANQDGDASGSIQSQLNQLDSLHDHEAAQAKDQDDLFGSTGHKGGLHSAAALSAHLEKGPHGPRFAGNSK